MPNPQELGAILKCKLPMVSASLFQGLVMTLLYTEPLALRPLRWTEVSMVHLPNTKWTMGRTVVANQFQTFLSLARHDSWLTH